MKLSPSLAVLSSLVIATEAALDVPIVKTTSGTLRGAVQDGVMSFKGIPFGQPPVGDLRWEAPRAFVSQATIDATTLGPACVQQFPVGFSTQAITKLIFNTPPPPESEDCLFLNVWAPVPTTGPGKPVVFWIYGGGFVFGTGTLPKFDGANELYKEQDIVVVTINHRTNAFGFPDAEELFPDRENLGLMDQELALQWVQDNIEAFGGDRTKVTLMGESSGAYSVEQAMQRHPTNAPFRAGIMQSGASNGVIVSDIPSFTIFDTMAKAVNCTQAPGPDRLACLRAVPADAIRAWANGPQAAVGFFMPMIDKSVGNIAYLLRYLPIRPNAALVPILLGANQDDGTFFAVQQTSLPQVLSEKAGSAVSADEVKTVYPGLNDTQIISMLLRDMGFVCSACGNVHVYRYMYGAVFADLQFFPGAGAYHSSEVSEIFGTFNSTTATTAEKALSHTMQTVWTNFIKDPTVPPAPNWQRFVPGNNTNGLARLAFNGNVEVVNVVQASPSGLDDGPCNEIWDALLAF